jgi:hypothetical protein
MLVDAQQKLGKVTGEVVDENSAILPFVQATLKSGRDSSLVKVVLADEKGHFEFEIPAAGKYLVELKMMGFKPLSLNQVFIQNPNQNSDLGTIKMVPSNITLAGVTIEGKKPFIERRADKIIINLNDLMSKGASINEVLDKLPGVKVDQDGRITLNGQGVQIYINGKLTPLSVYALSGMMKGMSASSVGKIELIAHPSAKYDAAGGGGIINLVKKRNVGEGVSGNIFGGIGKGEYAKYNGGLTINYKIKNINLLFNPNYNYNKTIIKSNIFSEITDRQDGTASIRNTDINTVLNDNTFNPSLGVDFNVTDRTILSLSGTTEFRNADKSANSLTYTGLGGEINIKDNQFLNTIKNSKDNTTAGMHLQHQMDTTGKEITYDFDYFNFRTTNGENYSIQNYFPSPKLKSSFLDQSQKFNVYSAKTDLTLPLQNKTQLEFGWKSSYTVSKNSNNFFNTTNDVNEITPSLRDRFRYQENINGLYAIYSKTADKLSYNIGLRAENTWGKGHQIDTGITINKSYIQLFPSIFIDYKFNKDHGLNFVAKKYVNRPTYENLNPLVRLINSDNYIQGNPDLDASNGYSFSATHLFKNMLFTTLGYNRVSNAITYFTVPYDNNTNILTTRPLNNLHTQYFNLLVSLNKQLTKWWYTSTYTNTSKRISKLLYNGMEIENKGILNFTTSSYNSFKLTKDLNFMFFYTYVSRSQDQNIINDANSYVTAGLAQNFLNKRASITISVTDLFNTYRNAYTQNSVNVNQNVFNDYETRIARIRFSYNFGGSIKKTKASTSADDQKDRSETKRNSGVTF